MPDEDEMPVETPIAPKALKDLQRAKDNDALRTAQGMVANNALPGAPGTVLLQVATSLASALGAANGSVTASRQGIGAGPIWISMTQAQATTLTTRLTTGLL